MLKKEIFISKRALLTHFVIIEVLLDQILTIKTYLNQNINDK